VNCVNIYEGIRIYPTLTTQQDNSHLLDVYVAGRITFSQGLTQLGNLSTELRRYINIQAYIEDSRDGTD
jgi:hypothetical protein